MNPYLVLAYTVSFAILAGYALALWLGARSLRRKELRR